MISADDKKTINDVYAFWNSHPLFDGEATHPLGSREWFEEHEQVYIDDCFAGQPPAGLFVEGVQRNEPLLDVGCGPGFWVRYFLRKN